MRDTAIDGLATLLRRDDWHRSGTGSSIADTVRQALHDPNPVVRQQAAHAAHALHADAEPHDRATNLSDLVLAETHDSVRTALLHQLWWDVRTAPAVIDTLLTQLLGEHRDSGLGHLPRDLREVFIALLTDLALTQDVPFSSETITQWCEHPPRHSSDIEAFLHRAKSHLRSSGSPRHKAFHLLGTAASAALQRWTANPAEHLPGADLPVGTAAELKGAARVAHAVARQTYFASGAFNRVNRESPPTQDLSEFADLAHPVLQTCAHFHIPQVTHPVVETLIFLAPHNEPRALHAIADAISPNDIYAADRMAGDIVIAYLERLLAEQRQLLLHDPHGVEHFRHLLGTLATAGNERALTLAYTFANVFR